MKTRDEHAEWTDRFSDYLDGDLAPADHARVEAHLAECGACRRVLEQLREVIGAARDLGPIQPERDLWGGIAATILAPAPRAEGAKVIALPLKASGAASQETEEQRSGSGRGRFSFSTPQLAAASVVLVVGSSLATWVAGPGLALRGENPVASARIPNPVTMVGSAAATPPPEMAAELALLEAALHGTRSDLDANTVRILERNLAVIEAAIEDSRQALIQDPGNAYLEQHLERVFERKLTYLREASRVAEWAG